MIRITTLLLMSAMVSLAAPVDCAIGTLDDYFSLDAEGCRLGGRVLSGFQVGSPTTGSTPIDPTGITVTPTSSGMTGSLLFTLNGSAMAGTILESVIQFMVAPDALTGELIDLQLIGAGATDDAVVTAILDACSGSFSAGVCQGQSQTILALRTAMDDLTSASLTRDPAPGYNLMQSIVVDGGLSGNAALTSAQLTFTTVPEPATWAMLAAGLITISALRRKRPRR